MKKAFALFLILSLFLLSGCGHEHSWHEATCTQPRTCSECGETEGEPLGHSPTEATVWEPSVCSLCGEVLGEKLVPAFERHNIEVMDIADVPTEIFAEDHAVIDPDTGYVTFPDPLLEFRTGSYNGGSYVPVYVCLTDYSIIESDEEHEALEGYEWRIASFQLVIFSTDAGYKLAASDEDYYDIEGHDDSAQGSHYTVTWQGESYDGCVRLINFSELPDYTMPVTGAPFDFSLDLISRGVTAAFRVPVGYDGTVVCLRNSIRDFERDQYIYDVMTPDDIFIRLT